MFLDDLSPVGAYSYTSSLSGVAIGWLDKLHEFTRGSTTDDFRIRLRQLCMYPVRQTRGFHECEFCSNADARGNGEIHISGADGVVYVAPALIWHYVVEHDYQPPSRFVDGVMTVSKDLFVPGHLSMAVERLAVDPTPANRLAFYGALVKGRVGIRVHRELGSLASRDYDTTNPSSYPIPQAQLPNGTPMLTVIADVDKLAKVEAGSTFVEVDAKGVLRKAIEKNGGIIVHAWLLGRDTMVTISASDVPDVLRHWQKVWVSGSECQA